MIPGRPSTRLFLAAGALAAVAMASTAYSQKLRRDFARPTMITMGKVVRSSARLSTTRRTQSELFCWVSYEFTPAEGGAARRNWHFWRPGCGVSPGRPIAVQYVVADPGLNRPAWSEPSLPISELLFFAAGVTLVIGFLVRGHQRDDLAPMNEER